jgi:hypothetical protein
MGGFVTLGEKLLEKIEKRLVHIRKDSQRRVHTHGSGGLVSAGSHRKDGFSVFLIV